MINKISFNNYKAFAKGEIELKPITLLLGANSVGKSAIAQLFLILQQTNEASQQNYKSALKMYGSFINLGEAENLFKDKNINKFLELGFNFKSSQIQEQFSTLLFERFLSYFVNTGHSIQLTKKHNRKWYKLLGSYSESYYSNDYSISEFKDYNFFKEFLENLTEALVDLGVEKKSDRAENISINKKYFFPGRRWEFSSNRYSLTKENHDEILLTFQMLSQLSKITTNSKFGANYILSTFQGRLFIKELSLEIDGIKILKIGAEKFDGKDYKVNFETILFDKKKINRKILLKLKRIFIPDNTIFTTLVKENLEPNSDPKNENSSIFANTIYKIFNEIQSNLKSTISSTNLNYVSPLRAHPQRYYMLDKAKLNMRLNTLDGDSLAEILKENHEIRLKVNEWLEKFGLNASVEIFKEVIHKLKISQNNLSLDITDVGFGISQVLPVIIQGFLSEEESLTIIEQPEIHLHPKMQADLADLYIDIVNQSLDKILLIETHSEYFLKRLRRRISEGKIDYKDVKIYLLHPIDGESGSYIEDLNIEKGGRFNYPKEYYSGELLKDSTEFMKMQIRNTK